MSDERHPFPRIEGYAGTGEPVIPVKHSHYKKDVRHLSMVDVYRVIDLFGVTHPALQHAIKKLLVAGNRGTKEWEQDVREAVDSLNRALQMTAEDEGTPARMYGVSK